MTRPSAFAHPVPVYLFVGILLIGVSLGIRGLWGIEIAARRAQYTAESACMCGDCAEFYIESGNVYRWFRRDFRAWAGLAWALGVLAISGGFVVAIAYKAAVWMRPRSLAPWQCGGCRYDLRGLRADAPCPECGRPRHGMTDG